MQPIISIKNLGKQFRLRHSATTHYKTLADTLMNLPRRIFGSASPVTSENFWALSDINLDIAAGERLGVIGRNGAGKSTLLKLLSRIMEPTTGSIAIRGSLSSLLEVGTGFHPELTGKENIYLYGAILGMPRQEVKRKFDAIVEFAEIEKFLDTPVKRYSSGMYMRLAFSVAAHLETDILIVDEVLAVGDVQFQKKCISKVGELNQSGRTILFVSHNLNLIESLCDRAILLQNGEIKADSKDVRSVIHQHLFGDTQQIHSEWRNTHKQLNNSWFTPSRFALTRGTGLPVQGPIANDEEIWIEIEGCIDTPDPALTVGYAVFSEEGQLLYWSYHTDGPEASWPELKNGSVVFRSRLPSRLLNEGEYRLELLASLQFRQWLSQAGSTPATINLTIQGGLSDSPYWISRRPGLLAPVIEWHTEARRT